MQRKIGIIAIPNMEETFACISGLPNHSLGDAVAIAGVTLGAKVVEKHLTLSRADGGSDSVFSMELNEFKVMVENIRRIESAFDKSTYELTARQHKSKERSRLLYVVADMKKGDTFTEDNLKSIGLGYGLHTKYWEQGIVPYAGDIREADFGEKCWNNFRSVFRIWKQLLKA